MAYAIHMHCTAPGVHTAGCNSKQSTCISGWTWATCTGAICCWHNLHDAYTLAGNGKFFLSLLPPKKILDAPEPVAAQLQFAPDQSEVVRLSEIMKDRPYHPSLTLQKALTRLAPTCRKLWNQMDWISETVAQV